MEKMFEKASRLKVRFNSGRGLIAVEDLWDLPLQSRDGINLDDIAKKLSKEVKSSEDESFVAKPTLANAELVLKFEIIKHIIAVRLEERDAAENRVKVKQQKEELAALIAKKKGDQLGEKSVEELEAMLNSL